MESLGTNTTWGVKEPIQSNDFPFCIECGVTITKENDSGWQRFKEDGRTTQSVCKTCDSKPSDGLKSE